MSKPIDHQTKLMRGSICLVIGQTYRPGGTDNMGRFVRVVEYVAAGLWACRALKGQPPLEGQYAVRGSDPPTRIFAAKDLQLVAMDTLQLVIGDVDEPL